MRALYSSIRCDLTGRRGFGATDVRTGRAIIPPPHPNSGAAAATDRLSTTATRIRARSDTASPIGEQAIFYQTFDDRQESASISSASPGLLAESGSTRRLHLPKRAGQMEYSTSNRGAPRFSAKSGCLLNANDDSCPETFTFGKRKARSLSHLADPR